MTPLEHARDLFELVTEIENIYEVKVLWITNNDMSVEIENVKPEKHSSPNIKWEDRKLEEL